MSYQTLLVHLFEREAEECELAHAESDPFIKTIHFDLAEHHVANGVKVRAQIANPASQASKL